MPEQYSDEDPTQLNFYKHFFDTGSRLESVIANPFRQFHPCNASTFSFHLSPSAPHPRRARLP